MTSNVQPQSVAVNFRVNGTDRQVSVDPRYALSDVLRDELSLTGCILVASRGYVAPARSLSTASRL